VIRSQTRERLIGVLIPPAVPCAWSGRRTRSRQPSRPTLSGV